MPHLSRNDMEAIGERVISAYKKLPEVSGKELFRIDPELLIRRLLKLSLGHWHLSADGSVLGLTSFSEVGVEVFDDTDTYVYCLDGRTILIESDLKADGSQRGRYNFTLAHEASHQILAMLFPAEYRRSQRRIQFYRIGRDVQRPITDWEEWQANALASTILMPRELVVQGMSRFGLGEKISVLNKVFRPSVYERFSELACFLGASKTALAIRMKHLGLLEEEYLKDPYALVRVEMEDHEMEDW